MKALNKAATEELVPLDLRYRSEKHLRKFCDVTSQALTRILGALIGELEFSQRERTGPTQLATDAADRALALARNLHFFSVHSRFDIQPADISQIVLDTIDLIEKELDSRKIQLAVFVDASVQGATDASALRQILLNLFANASNSMPNGGNLSVSLRQYTTHIEIICSDTGPAIPQEALNEIFEPSSEHNDFVGLKLAVARALVEALGGEISVNSDGQLGTTFRVRLSFDAKSSKPVPYGDKRRFQRVAVSFPAEFRVEKGKSHATELVTLSTGGGFILLPDPHLEKLEITDAFELKIFYYRQNFISVPRARIASVIKVGPNAGLGLEFFSLDAKASTILTALVRSHAL